MRPVKRPLCAERLRRVPESFSWIDHRLVREGHISRIGLEAQALYLFLVTVCDAEGLSYYSDAKSAQLLGIGAEQLAKGRRELIDAGLIAWERPLYQVLALDTPLCAVVTPQSRVRGERGEAQSIGDVLRHALGGAS